MPVRRDVQTVGSDGSPLEDLPEGMLLRPLVTHADDRGTVCELYDDRWGVHPDPATFAYMFTIRPGQAKGWGMHMEHEDRYAFIAGELELAFYDAREGVAGAGRQSRLVLSHHARSMLVIPRGVWHAERNIGSTDVVVVNFPTIPYDHANPDKYRLPLDTDELPVTLGDGWVGW